MRRGGEGLRGQTYLTQGIAWERTASLLLGTSCSPGCQQSKHLHTDELASISKERDSAVSRSTSFCFEILSPSSARASEKFIFPQNSTCSKHLKIKLVGFRTYSKLIASVCYCDPNIMILLSLILKLSIVASMRIV